MAAKRRSCDPNLAPANFKQEILDTLRRTLDDPTNVHDAFISDPALTQVGNEPRYAACVRYNPRGLNRTYAGNTERIAYFYGGHLNQLVEPSKANAPRPSTSRSRVGEDLLRHQV